MPSQISRPLDNKSYLGRSFDNFLLRSWWVIFVALIGFVLCEQGVASLREQKKELSLQLRDLKKKQRLVLAETQDLELQFRSQSDYEWAELTLKRGLGLIGHGQKKVYFKRPQGTERRQR